MRHIAPARAIPTKDGFGRPFFMHALRQGLLVVSAAAGCQSGLTQEAIYRCGQEYTNAPRDLSRCERLAEQAVTVIPGVRPQAVPVKTSTEGQAPDESRSTQAEPARASTTRQTERDAQARTILVQELERVQKQHQSWVQAYKQGTPIQLSPEHAAPLQDHERVAALKAAIDRAARDIDSLQRELAQRTVKP